jgi:hypothetical protein
MRPSLTVLVATINGEAKLPIVLPQVREIADELVVAVDDATTDCSVEIAHRHADTVCSIPHRTFLPGRRRDRPGPLDLALEHCRGDWILRVDHDETPSANWKSPGRMEELLSDRHATHYNVLRRWAVPPGDRFISSAPWYADYHVRLFRNLPAILRPPNAVHTDLVVLGEGRWLTQEWLIHWDLVWHSRELREGKCETYEKMGRSGAPFYLYEGQAYRTRPLDYIPPVPSPLPVNHSDTSETRALACCIQALEIPAVMTHGATEYLVVALTNLSPRLFVPAMIGLERGNVSVSYHWLDLSADVVSPWDHERVELPGRLLPGQSAVMLLPIREWPEPGSYLLQLDLVEEGVAWASHQGIPVPAYPIEVIAPGHAA